jgi:hypothetical protein
LRFTESYASKGRLGTIEHGYEILGMLKRMKRGLPRANARRKA